MEPSDYIELIIMSGDSLGSHVMNYIYILFAYLVMTYFAGNRLTRLQVWIVSILYTAVLVLPANAAFQRLSTMNALTAEFLKDFPGQASVIVNQTPTLPVVSSIFLASSWIVSIVFMVSVRRKQKEISGDV